MAIEAADFLDLSQEDKTEDELPEPKEPYTLLRKGTEIKLPNYGRARTFVVGVSKKSDELFDKGIKAWEHKVGVDGRVVKRNSRAGRPVPVFKTYRNFVIERYPADDQGNVYLTIKIKGLPIKFTKVPKRNLSAT